MSDLESLWNPRARERNDRRSLGRDVTPIDVSPDQNKASWRREQDATGARTKVLLSRPSESRPSESLAMATPRRSSDEKTLGGECERSGC